MTKTALIEEAKRTAWNKGKQIRPPITVNCDNCGLVFNKYENGSKFNFCSVSCLWKCPEIDIER